MQKATLKKFRKRLNDAFGQSLAAPEDVEQLKEAKKTKKDVETEEKLWEQSMQRMFKANHSNSKTENYSKEK
uniref:Uncharacterized protein n=1 Tax=Romanomermis culicivorax TaxID=13658 RepID=A0A915J3B2_ROMCU